MKLIMPIALPGSGKSTYAKRLVEAGEVDVIVSADSFFEGPDGYMFDPTKIGAAHEACWLAFGDAVAARKSVFVDNTNLLAIHREPYVSKARKNGYTVILTTFPVPTTEQEVVALHRRQVHGVPLDRMLNMWRTMEVPE